MSVADRPTGTPMPTFPSLRTRDFRRTTLGAASRRTARALAEAFFVPANEVEARAARLDAFVDELDAFISPASKTLRFGLVAMLVVLRWSPLLFGRPSTFEGLDIDARVHHLERLERSRIARLPLLVVAYKTVMTMLFYEDDEELRALGYPGAARQRFTRGLPLAH
jgi:hypothetical protein